MDLVTDIMLTTVSACQGNAMESCRKPAHRSTTGRPSTTTETQQPTSNRSAKLSCRAWRTALKRASQVPEISVVIMALAELIDAVLFHLLRQPQGQAGERDQQ